MALDGTEYFCSQKLSYPQCLTRKRANGKTEHYHAMLAVMIVAPGHNMVLPLMSEFITLAGWSREAGLRAQRLQTLA